jgi:ATP-dependent helicase/nuclease subunit A
VVLRTVLRAIEWPDDSLSVYATLRGPLFSIADEMLFQFREAVGFLPHPLRKLPEGIETTFQPVVEALDCLAELHKQRNDQPIPVLLTRLLERVRAYSGFALRKGGERVLANVYPIVDLARRFELNGATSFRAFVTFLEEEAESREASETPLLERRTGGVTLMTAHKSKGLEFPVVIFADMDRNMLRFDGGGRFVDAEGLAAQRLLEWAPQELLDNGPVEAERDRQEGIRLAYVAATRARDLLVVAATGDEIRQESWLAPLYDALYPSKGSGQKPEAAPGCPFTGKATVLQRPQGVEPIEYGRDFTGPQSAITKWSGLTPAFSNSRSKRGMRVSRIDSYDPQRTSRPAALRNTPIGTHRGLPRLSLDQSRCCACSVLPRVKRILRRLGRNQKLLPLRLMRVRPFVYAPAGSW